MHAFSDAYKLKMENEHIEEHQESRNGENSAVYLPQLQAEFDSIDDSFTEAKKLLETGNLLDPYSLYQ